MTQAALTRSQGRLRRMLTASMVVAAGMLLPAFLRAQDSGLPFMGSLTYNLLDFDTRLGQDTHPRALRFVGRVAFRLNHKTYVGFSVGSWVRVYEGCPPLGLCSSDYYDEYSEVVNHAIYVQRYATSRWFFRAGAGTALTEVLTPNGDVIATSRHARASVTAGTGYDIPFVRRMLLTPSLDYAQLPGTASGGGEIHWALAYGLGITLR